MTSFFTSSVPSKTSSLISILALAIFLPLMLLAVYQTATLLSRASGTPANITIDTKTELEPISTDFYHAFAQGGEESNNMLSPISSQVRALKPRVIRIDHLYDHYSVVGKQGDALTFDWQRLDELVDTILATGAKPLLVLSYMPSVIARDGIIINPPNDWNQWATVVQKTIEHYSGRGEKNINGVYYECWNEPDLDQFGSWKMQGEKNYLTLYRYCSIGANNATGTNAFHLGGPVTTGLYKNWILSLVSSGNRLDFISWHSYLGDPAQYATDQRNIASWLLPFPTSIILPKLITEHGITGSKSALYGTTYASAYEVAVIRQLISGGPTYLFSFELKDGPQDTSEGWGLITHESKGLKTKPRYAIYSFLDSMAGKRLRLTGEGSWVTGFSTKKENTIRVLLVNFDRNGNHVETVPVTFANLDQGSYSFHEKHLFGTDTTLMETVSEASLQKRIYMPAQSVVLLELKKQ